MNRLFAFLSPCLLIPIAGCSAPPCEDGGDCGGECLAVQPGPCPNPQVSFDPDAALGMDYPSPEQAEHFIVGRLEPFPHNVLCHTVIIGLAVGSWSCQTLEDVDVVVFDSETNIPTATPTAAHLTVDMDKNVVPLPDKGLYEVRLLMETSHTCGQSPFVGIKVRGDTCIVEHQATCDTSNGWRFDGVEWGPISESGPIQVYAGLDDCEVL